MRRATAARREQAAGAPSRRAAGAWWTGHRRAARWGLAQCRENPLASGLAVAVMAVALALPALLAALLAQRDALLADWHVEPTLTLFLAPGINHAAAAGLAGELAADDALAGVDVVSAEQAFAELAGAAGLAGELDAASNPLPHLLVVRPRASAWRGDEGRALARRLGALEGVEDVLLDLAWLDRLAAIVRLGERGVLVLTFVLVAGTVLVTANTIRVLVHQHGTEIDLYKLVGATDAFVRRPFLYSGAIYGLAAGVAAVLVVEGVLLALADPVAAVARAYASDYALAHPGAVFVLSLLGLGMVTGWCGAWLGTSHSLRRLANRGH